LPEENLEVGNNALTVAITEGALWKHVFHIG
jgi:hypothetical protein